MTHLDSIQGQLDPEPTQAEILLYNLKDSHVPTLVVEGPSDKKIYTWVRDWLSKHFIVPNFIDIQPVGGKDEVLKVYENRSKFEKQVAVAFMVDQDKWVFSGIPFEYQNKIMKCIRLFRPQFRIIKIRFAVEIP